MANKSKSKYVQMNPYWETIYFNHPLLHAKHLHTDEEQNQTAAHTFFNTEPRSDFSHINQSVKTIVLLWINHN